MSIPDPKIFERKLFEYDPNREMMLKALDIVKEFIIDNNLVITGGMAIDFALRLKGEKLYDDETLPDYDFFSPIHSTHAYELGSILCKRLRDVNGDMPSISVIDALHITSMRVRVNFTTVADLTYLPLEIYNKLITLEYPIGQRKIKFRHPHMQMIDQHRALSLPYENSPYEVILHRWSKDMKRFDMLYNHYPIEGKKIPDDKFQNVDFDISLLQNTCVAGFAGLYLLTRKEPVLEIKLIKNSNNLMPLVLLSQYAEHATSLIMDKYKAKSVKYFNEYLDRLPHYISIVLENGLEIHIYDTTNRLVAAEKHSGSKTWIADAQFNLSYFLMMSFRDEKNKQLYLDAYCTLAELVKEGIKKPTHITFGDSNLGTEHILSRAQILSQNKDIPKIRVILKPQRFYPSDENDCKINESLNNFSYEQSPLFHIDGNEVSRKPIQIIDLINPVMITDYNESSDSDKD